MESRIVQIDKIFKVFSGDFFLNEYLLNICLELFSVGQQCCDRFHIHFGDELSLANGYTKKTAIIIDPVNLACLSFFRSVTVQCNE